jgi:hypothetical protein
MLIAVTIVGAWLVESVLVRPESSGFSHSSGLPAAFGETPDGRYIIVVYQEIDEDSVRPVTAYEV